MAIGRISRVALRDVWKNEAHDFTKWLVDNIDVLSEIIDLRLQDPRREHAAGDFSSDLVAKDEDGNLVVIENQLEKSNHDHLGKVITYVATLAAKTAIWIVSNPRAEHISAITWLNESRLANFYLIKLEAIRIGNSDSAPLLTLITGPSEETRELGDTKKEIADRYDIRRRFWDGLLTRARQRTRLHEAVSPSSYSYLWAGAGKSGLGYRYSITQHEAEIGFYINLDTEEANRAILNKLRMYKSDIEAAFGSPLIWYEQEGVRHCRIAYDIAGGYRDPEDKWPAIQETMIDAMIRLEKALKPHLAEASLAGA